MNGMHFIRLLGAKTGWRYSGQELLNKIQQSQPYIYFDGKIYFQGSDGKFYKYTKFNVVLSEAYSAGIGANTNKLSLLNFNSKIYVATSGGIKKFDISNDTLSDKLGTGYYTSGLCLLGVKDNYLYFASNGWLNKMDTSDTASDVKSSFPTVLSGKWIGDNLYMIKYDGTLQVFDGTTVSNLTAAKNGNYNTCCEMLYSGGGLFYSIGAKTYRWDVAAESLLEFDYASSSMLEFNGAVYINVIDVGNKAYVRKYNAVTESFDPEFVYDGHTSAYSCPILASLEGKLHAIGLVTKADSTKMKTYIYT